MYKVRAVALVCLLALAALPAQLLHAQTKGNSTSSFPEQDTKKAAATSSAQAAAEPPEGEEDDDFAARRNAWFTGRRAYPFAHIPSGAMASALRQRQALQRHAPAILFAVRPGKGVSAPQATSSSSPLWTFDGPADISLGGSGNTPYSGRATSLVIDPGNPQVMYLGTAAGGVWKTTDGGLHWTPVTDSQASLAIGALAIDPNNSAIIYAGTGEADYSGDSYYGAGLLKSSDSGQTWTQIASPFVDTQGSAPPFAQIAIQPGNSSVLLAATEAGLFRSVDAGATWSNRLPSYASAVLFDPAHPNTAYAGVNGYFSSIVYPTVTAAIYKSTDAGQTWTALTGGVGGLLLPSGNTIARVALSMDSAGALLAGLAPSNGGTGAPYKSTDGGKTWGLLSLPGDGLDWYRDWIVSVPGSPNILYTGGVNLYQSLDGGLTWAKSSESYASLLWADQHAAVFSPDGSRMYLMDDGGIFMTSAPAASNSLFTSLNNGIGSMTFYPGFGITPTDATVVGSQDHGTQTGSAGQPWNYSGGGNVCGDGGPVTLDSTGTYAYAHCQGSPLSSWMVSPTGGAVTSFNYPYGWAAAQTGINLSDRTGWVPPITADPGNAAIVYTGTYRVYQSTNHATSWTSISGDLTGGSSTLSTIAVAPGNANVVYTGADDGSVAVTSNALAGASATWTKLTGLPNRAIGKIVVMPDSPQDVYVSVSGFGSGHLFHSVDGGVTWKDLTGDLPDAPVNSVDVDPSLLNTIYVATDTGVYGTNDGGVTWSVLGANLPNVVVQDLQIVASTRLLRVVTHGRGAWDLTLPLAGVTVSANQLNFGAQSVGTASAAQSLTLSNNLSSAAAISGITSSAPDFAVANTCGASLASGATCSINVTFTPSAAGQENGTLTIATAQGTVTVALTGYGSVFALSSASTTASVTAGSTASYSLTLASSPALTTAATLSCAGVPSNSSCTFSPATVAVGATSQAITLSIATKAATIGSLIERPIDRRAATILACALLALWMVPRKRRMSWSAFLIVMSVLAFSTACSGGGHSTQTPATTIPGTPAGSYTITVTAQAGANSATQTLQLAVN